MKQVTNKVQAQNSTGLVVLNFRVPERLHAKLRKFAFQQRQSGRTPDTMAKIVCEAVELYFSTLEQRKAGAA